MAEERGCRAASPGPPRAGLRLDSFVFVLSSRSLRCRSSFNHIVAISCFAEFALSNAAPCPRTTVFWQIEHHNWQSLTWRHFLSAAKVPSATNGGPRTRTFLQIESTYTESGSLMRVNTHWRFTTLRSTDPAKQALLRAVSVVAHFQGFNSVCDDGSFTGPWNAWLHWPTSISRMRKIDAIAPSLDKRFPSFLK